jgi:hypothetical protein
MVDDRRGDVAAVHRQPDRQALPSDDVRPVDLGDPLVCRWLATPDLLVEADEDPADRR